MSDRLLTDWLQGYLAATANLEAKEQLHRWTGLVCISAAIRRRLFLKMQHGVVYPNLYVYIVAKSARARKSTAMSYGYKLLLDTFPEMRIFGDDMTAQGLIKYLYSRAFKTNDKKPQGDFVIFSDELADLYSNDKARAAKMAIMLTTTFMCRDVYDHLTSKDSLERLYNMYPVMLAATDPENLKVLPPNSIGGLTGRIIWLTEHSRRHINPGWIEDNSREDLEREYLRECLIHDLHRISLMEGQLQVTRDARALYDPWYQRLSTTVTGDRNQDAFYNRCHTTALQVATLLSVSNSDDMIISKAHMEEAIRLIELQAPEIKQITTLSGTGVYEQQRARFVLYLQANGGRVLRKNLISHMGLELTEFDKVTATLVEDGTIERPGSMNTSNGRVEVVTLTKKGMEASPNGASGDHI